MRDNEASHIYKIFVKKYLDTFVKYIQEYADKYFPIKDFPINS